MNAAGMVWFPVITDFAEFCIIVSLIEETLPGGGTETLTAWEHYNNEWMFCAGLLCSSVLNAWADAYFWSFIGNEDIGTDHN